MTSGRAVAAAPLVFAAVLLASPRSARAQSSDAAAPALGASFGADALTDLPLGGSALTLGAAAEPATIADRVDTGGLSAGRASIMGSHGASPTQTTFWIDGTPIVDPDATGAPLMQPGVVGWERVELATGMLPIQSGAPGGSFSFTPKSAAAAWGGSAEAAVGPRGLVTDPHAGAPPIARSAGWQHAGLFASGPVVAGTGLAIAAEWSRSSRTDRAHRSPVSESLGSLFAHLESTPRDRDRLHVFAWTERAASPFGNRVPFAQTFGTAHDASGSIEGGWSHRARAALLDAFASYTGRTRGASNTPAGPVVIERLADGPVQELLYPGVGPERRWSAGSRIAPATPWLGDRHRVRAGVQLFGASATMRPAMSGTIGELVDGLPARVWQYDTPSHPSQWGATQFVAYAADEVTLGPRLTASAGLRWEAVNGAAAGSAQSIAWRNALPRAAVRWAMTDVGHIDGFASFARYASRLPLTWLAYGDPNAASGRVFTWTSSTPQVPPASALGPIVSLVGPGTGGRTDFATIDPRLRRPFTDEIAAGFEAHPHRRISARVTGMMRRQKQDVRLVDVGAPRSSYQIVTVPDPGLDIARPIVPHLLAGYDRLPSSFGADRYVLTNPADDTANFVGVEATADVRWPRAFLTGGATAGRALGYAAYRGFHAVENDQDLPGEIYVDPNAETNSHGRLFVDRGYTIKIAGMYQVPYDVVLGVVARYQDGQPFSRMVIFSGLAQGAEAVRAFTNGGTRFTYTTTVDARVQKGFAAAGHHITLVIDVYNVFDALNEIEEYTVTGTGPRVVSAVQPPRAIQAGLRVSF